MKKVLKEKNLKTGKKKNESQSIISPNWTVLDVYRFGRSLVSYLDWDKVSTSTIDGILRLFENATGAFVILFKNNGKVIFNSYKFLDDHFVNTVRETIVENITSEPQKILKALENNFNSKNISFHFFYVWANILGFLIIKFSPVILKI